MLEVVITLMTYHAIVNVNLMEENVIQINGEVMINVDRTGKKNIICVKKIIFGILVYVVTKVENIQQVLLTI